MANEFRRSFDEMARQSELDELRKEIENLRAERPLAGVERDLHKSILPDDMKSAPAPSADRSRSSSRPSRATANSRSPTRGVTAGYTPPQSS